MNKNEFYKQLMMEYTFDSEKIKRNAKKGKFAKQRVTPVSLGITAAVAACTVAMGTLALTLLNNGGVNLLPSNSSTLSAMSVEDRVKRALEQQDKERGSSEIHDVIVTFNYPMTAGEARKVLTDYLETDSIPVKAVYFGDGSKASGNDEVKAVFEGEGASDIIGTVVSCSGDVMTLLQNDPAICLVEIMGEDDYDTALPVNPKDVETTDPAPPPKTDNSSSLDEEAPPPIAVKPPVESVPSIAEPQPETAETNVTKIPVEETESASEIISTEESFEDTNQTFETSEPPDIPETQPPLVTETAEPTSDPETSVPDVPVILPPHETQDSDEPASLPEGVTLPANVGSLSVETFIDADSAFFLNEDTFFVKTSYDIALYKFDGTSESMITSVACTDAKLCWVSDNNGQLLVIGADENGRRDKLFFVDADSGAIYDLQAEDTVMDGTLVNVGYNSSSGMLFMNIRENGRYYVCSFTFNGSGLDFYGNTFESEAKTTLMCSEGTTLYLATYDGSLTLINAVDIVTGTSRIVKSYENDPSISKNLAFTHSVISPSENAVIGFIEIFDPSSETFVNTGYFGVSLNFGASRHSYCADGSYYTISGGAAQQSGGISVIGQIDYRKSKSGSYAASVTSSGTVKITASSYSKDNYEASLTFGGVKENSPDELRAALNGAIGINNAFALKKTEESGIINLATANRCVSVYYSESASEMLAEKIELSSGSKGKLKYNSAALKGINTDNTILVIESQNEETASGILYIKCGSFNGKTAYCSLNVSFVFENNSWKLNTLL